MHRDRFHDFTAAPSLPNSMISPLKPVHRGSLSPYLPPSLALPLSLRYASVGMLVQGRMCMVGGKDEVGDKPRVLGDVCCSIKPTWPQPHLFASDLTLGLASIWVRMGLGICCGVVLSRAYV